MPDQPPVEPDSTSSRRGLLRALGWAVTGAWAALWVIAGIGSGLDPTNDNTLLAGLALAGGLGLVPVVPFWIRWWRQGRREAEVRRATEDVVARQRQQDAERARLARLPDTVRDDWQRLEHAHQLVQGFAEQGWIEAASVAEVEGQVARLERLLAADRATDELGGTPSVELERQTRELTELLVALADEAVEHQATLVSDAPVPATLAEARDRLAATRQAYQDLTWQEPGQERRQYP